MYQILPIFWFLFCRLFENPITCALFSFEVTWRQRKDFKIHLEPKNFPQKVLARWKLVFRPQDQCRRDGHAKKHYEQKYILYVSQTLLFNLLNKITLHHITFYSGMYSWTIQTSKFEPSKTHCGSIWPLSPHPQIQ